MLDKYYFCYSPRMSDYLWKHGVFCITKARNLNSNKIFSLYENTPELQEMILKYESNKQNA